MKANNVKISKDFQVVARIESIFNRGINDAVKERRLTCTGANLITIHSKNKDLKEIFEFMKRFKKSKHFKPMIVVPSHILPLEKTC